MNFLTDAAWKDTQGKCMDQQGPSRLPDACRPSGEAGIKPGHRSFSFLTGMHTADEAKAGKRNEDGRAFGTVTTVKRSPYLRMGSERLTSACRSFLSEAK